MIEVVVYLHNFFKLPFFKEFIGFCLEFCHLIFFAFGGLHLLVFGYRRVAVAKGVKGDVFSGEFIFFEYRGFQKMFNIAHDETVIG